MSNSDRLDLELIRREAVIDRIKGHLFPEQLAFIEDKHRFKTAQCNRRAAKSYTGGAYFNVTGTEFPRCTMLYIAQTREMAKRIMIKDVLEEQSRKFNLRLKFNRVTLEVKYPSGSMLYLMGTDSSPEEANKLLGQKYKLVLIDESATYKQDQRELIYNVLMPACADQRGTIAMIGAPNNDTGTLFFDITGREEDDPLRVKGWSNHKWSWENNPHTREEVKELIQHLIASNPLIVETPGFQQNYMNKWVVDPGSLVYKYNPDGRNNAQTLPKDHEYFYSITVDLGYEDPTAFLISAQSTTDTNLYFVETYEQARMDLTDVANVLEMYKKKFNPVKWVIDGSSKQAVEEFKKRYHFPFVAADRTGKSDIIELFNADLIMGKIKVLPAAHGIIEDWKKLIWDPNTDKREEKKTCKNHRPDCGLYTWRGSYHYASKAVQTKPQRGSEAEVDAWWDKEANRIQRVRRRGVDPVLRDFGSEYGIKR